MAKTAINVFYNEAHMIVLYITIFSLHMQAYVVASYDPRFFWTVS